MTDSTDPYLYYLITACLAFSAWNALQNVKHCNLLTKIKTALIIKYPDLATILK